jgi:hypothetical protein
VRHAGGELTERRQTVGAAQLLLDLQDQVGLVAQLGIVTSVSDFVYLNPT